MMNDNDKLHDQLRDIKSQFRLYMNGALAQSMRERGILYKVNFGIELPRIKQIAAQYPKEHHLAQALWKEDIRECKILAGMLQPVETFYPEIMDIWLDSIYNMELAEQTSMNLFQNLPYAPQKSLELIAGDGEFRIVCGFLIIGRLLMKKPDMADRVENEFLDQAVAQFVSGNLHVRSAVSTALRRYILGSEQHAFTLCRAIEPLKDSADEGARLLYSWVGNEVSVAYD